MKNNRPLGIYYGGDYNPDQWPRETWDEDMRLFKLAHINIATVPVFSWASLQPSEDRYEFGWLDSIVDLLWKNGVGLCMATSTGAHPAWMAKRHPDVLRVDFQGRKRTFGMRHNSCPNSPTYRTYAARLAGKLAECYGSHPGLALWHISNEFGGTCYCENCAAAFRQWLERRYGTLDELNARWYTAFWGHTFYEWEEIVPPNALSESWQPNRTSFQGIALDYARFISDSQLECYRIEYDALKRFTPDVPVTTNLMGTYKELDYFAWAPHLDIISWDSYPPMDEPPSDIAMRHDLMRGLKQGQPFMLMEQTPSQQNWQAYNSLKRPGVLRLWSHQAIAHGADAVMYFQLRQSLGASEKWHGAVISHAGHENTRVFREVAELGSELEGLGGAFLGARVKAPVALLFDWETWWALDMSSGPSQDLHYVSEMTRYYRALWNQGVGVDMVSPDFDISAYRLLIAPLTYLVKPGFAEKIERFVESGGTFLTTSYSGMVDENDRAFVGGYPGPLRKVLGVWVEEFDALPPDKLNQISITAPAGGLAGSYNCSLLYGIMHAETAETLGVYGSDFYAGSPALTRNRLGSGQAYYVASHGETTFIEGLVAHLCAEQGIQPILQTPAGVEVTQREADGKTFTFVLNHNEQAVGVDVTSVSGRNLLSGQTLTGEATLPAKGVWIIEKAR